MPPEETADAPRLDWSQPQREPCLVALWSALSPTCERIDFAKGGHALKIGRREGDRTFPQDITMSSRHASFIVEGDELVIRDEGTRNGIYLDGEKIASAARVSLTTRHVLLVGGTIFLVEPDRARLDARNDLRVDDPVIGPSVAGKAVHEAWAGAVVAARLKQTLLVLGPTGTGKERVARLYHGGGPHSGGPFVDFNCSTIPSNLADSTLFGHARGAFTGATGAGIGLFEQADGGTLFLDEIGELPIDVQAKFLKVLENGEIRTVGGSGTKKVDVRVVCATHRDLDALVGADLFREDLLQRIKPRTVSLPALHDRKEEIPFLISSFATPLTERPASATFVYSCLCQPEWRGNIRTLAAVVDIAATDGSVHHNGSFDLHPSIISKHAAPAARPVPLSELPLAATAASIPVPAEPPAVAPLATVTKAAIERALAVHEGDMTATAEALGVSRSGLYKMCERYGIPIPGR